MNYGYMYSNGFDFWALLGHILIVLLIIWVIVRLVRGPRWHRGFRGPGMFGAHSALAILNERFAKGEISKEEYEERKKTLLGQ
jgi:putative membrane protein